MVGHLVPRRANSLLYLRRCEASVMWGWLLELGHTRRALKGICSWFCPIICFLLPKCYQHTLVTTALPPSLHAFPGQLAGMSLNGDLTFLNYSCLAFCHSDGKAGTQEMSSDEGRSSLLSLSSPFAPQVPDMEPNRSQNNSNGKRGCGPWERLRFPRPSSQRRSRYSVGVGDAQSSLRGGIPAES